MFFGRQAEFPIEFGGGETYTEQVYQALLDFYAPVFDSDEDELPAIEAYAEATVLAAIFVACARARNQEVATKMIENLPVWEESTRIRPAATATDKERRDALAAKLRGIIGNAMPDIRDACRSLLGVNYVNVHTSSAVTWWLGGTPGMPGEEWATDRAHLAVEVSQFGLNDAQFSRVTDRLSRTLDDLLPGWMTHTWFVGDSYDGEVGFYTEQSLTDYHGT
jgi:hypothetical protein